MLDMIAPSTRRLTAPLPPSLAAELIGRSFIAPHSLSPRAFNDLINFALALKNGHVYVGQPLLGKTVALIFFNPSLRTRSSMAVAIHQLGGHPLVLDVGGGVWGVEWREGAVMDGDKAEHIKEMAPVIGSYADICAVRCFPAMQSYADDSSEPVMTAFQRLSGKPLINLESSLHHPCQALGDMMTIKEHLGPLTGRKVVLAWAYHPKALPLAVPNSFVSAAALAGAHITIAAPPEFSLEPQFLADTKAWARAGGGDVVTTTDRDAALADAQVVYAKSWVALPHYGKTAEEHAVRTNYKHWTFDDAAFAKAPTAKFMHCLPVRRNVEVSDGVLDSPRSLVIPEAANRLHGQKALLAAMALANGGRS